VAAVARLMRTYRLRPFQPADQAAVRQLVLAGLASRFGFADESLTPDLDDFQASYGDIGGEVWVATAPLEMPIPASMGDGDAEIIACGALKREPSRPEALRIVRMSVKPAYQGQGVARAIGEKLIERARMRRAACVLTETNDDWHSALRLYQGLGFQETHRLYVAEFDFTEVHMQLVL